MKSWVPGAWPRSGARATERGLVTVELAVGIVTAVLLTAVLVSLSMLGLAQAACAESSAQIARQSARGDDAMVQQARQRAPKGAHIEVAREAEGVEVRVQMPVALVGLGEFTVSANAWAPYEPGTQR